MAGNNPQSKGGDFYRVHSSDDVPPKDGWERGHVGRFAATTCCAVFQHAFCGATCCLELRWTAEGDGLSCESPAVANVRFTMADGSRWQALPMHLKQGWLRLSSIGAYCVFRHVLLYLVPPRCPPSVYVRPFGHTKGIVAYADDHNVGSPDRYQWRVGLLPCSNRSQFGYGGVVGRFRRGQRNGGPTKCAYEHADSVV